MSIISEYELIFLGGGYYDCILTNKIIKLKRKD